MHGRDDKSALGARCKPWGTAVRLGSLLLLGSALAMVPDNPRPAEKRAARQVIVLAELPTPALPVQQPAAALEVAPVALLPEVRERVTPLAMARVVPEAEPAIESEPVMLVVAATPSAPVPVVPPPAPRADAALLAPRVVDIAQLTGPAERSLHVPQLREPGLVAGAPATLVAKVDSMQVPIPAPPNLTGEDRAVLLAAAPSEMTVRIGDDAVGLVAFRVGEGRSIDVQLSGLLDLVADHLAPEDYTRLRNSAAADRYVPLDELRAIGLSLRYDPVYDELDLSA